MGKVSKQTKAEVAELLKKIANTKSAKESADLAQQIEDKVAEATKG